MDTFHNLAYRMLGTIADAEDVVQEARLRLSQLAQEPRDERAYLFRTVANLAVDRLRRQKLERAHYAGPWLPEPVPQPVPQPEDTAELAEQLSLGLMWMLERMTPSERVAFVLREGFDLPMAEIGELLGVSEAAARQRLRRARQRLAAEPVEPMSVAAQHELLDQLMLAVAQDDVQQVASLLHEDVVAYTDGGGVVSAAIIPVTDPQRVAQVTLHLVRKASALGEMRMERRVCNGDVVLVTWVDGVVHSAVHAVGEDGKVRWIYAMRNPAKLSAFR